MNLKVFPAIFFLMAAAFAGAEPLQISALHPLMADLARQVGGERVRVFDLVGEGGNPHRFEPKPADMKQMQDSAMILAAGKNLEPYLGRLKSALKGVEIVEVGETIPSIIVEKGGACQECAEHHHEHADDEDSEEHEHEHEHAEGSPDPHWWQSIENMRRAARIVAREFATKDPEGKDAFFANAQAYGKRLEALKKWANEELEKVPKERRKLVTAHYAFAYFGKEFGFEVIALAGLNAEQNTTPKKQAETIEAVAKSGVPAVFPEKNASAKVLEAISTATKMRLGEPLIADGNGTGNDAGFEAMIRHNVKAITKALAQP